jgi:cytidine deaminase
MAQTQQTFEQLIAQAKKLAVKRELTSDVTIGRVGCVLTTTSGKEYTGINLKAAGDLGFCAEVTALAQMITAGESEVEFVTTVNSDGEIIPPCGRCRELLYQINRNNLKTKIVFSATESVELKELLPRRWQEYWKGRA